MPRLTLAALAAALFVAAPTAARASTLNVSSGVLTHSAQAGRTTNIKLVQTGATTVTVTRLAGDNDDFGAGADALTGGAADDVIEGGADNDAVMRARASPRRTLRLH